MERKTIRKEIEIPAGVELKLGLSTVAMKGPAGSVERTFAIGKLIELKQENNKVIVECKKAAKKEKKVAHTVAAHIKNMVEGVVNGFEYKLQICSIHFPITVAIEKNMLVIKNFLGETKNRSIKLPQNVDVEIKGDIITIKGANIESVAQCAASIELATRIKNRDRRVFEDGIFITMKAGEKL